MTTRRCVITLLLASQLSACIGLGDAFGESKRIAGHFALQENEGEIYQLTTIPVHLSVPGSDPLEGILGKVGWTTSYIVAWQTDGSGKPGWLIIDVRSDRIEGPLTDAEFASRRAQLPELGSLVLRTPREAWNLL